MVEEVAEVKRLLISIHAPREGSDRPTGAAISGPARFQSTLPVRGATAQVVRIINDYRRFQSTLPVRGATQPNIYAREQSDISIHAPREGSDKSHGTPPSGQAISIHAPREGSDDEWETIGYTWSQFQSTLPVRGATVLESLEGNGRGSDFNPRSP